MDKRHRIELLPPPAISVEVLRLMKLAEKQVREMVDSVLADLPQS